MKKVLAVFLFLLLISCSNIESGNIIKKWYEPAREYTTTTYIMVGKIMVPSIQNHYDDEDFCILIEGFNKENKLRQREICLTQKQYESVSIGDYFSIEQ